MTPPGIRWAGPRALLIELASLESVLTVHAHLQQHPLRGQVDLLAAARTVLAVFDTATNALAARAAVVPEGEPMGPTGRPGLAKVLYRLDSSRRSSSEKS